MSPVCLLVFGLFLETVGALLVALEGFGIGVFLRRLDDGSTMEHRLVAISYTSLVNRVSVFFLSNTCWVLALILLGGVSLTVSFLLWPFGYVLWRIAVEALRLLAEGICRLAPPHRQHAGQTRLVVGLMLSLVWAVAYVTASLISIIAEYAVDLPLRFVGERLVGSSLIAVCRHANKFLERRHPTQLKVPMLFGAGLLVVGLIYQILGTILLARSSNG